MPEIFEGNLGSDWFKILVYGPGEDENFRQQARQVKLDLQRLPGVAMVQTKGLEDPELHVVFHPERLAGLGISPTALADTVSSYFKDIAAGVVKVDEREWLLRVTGTEDAATRLAQLPVIAAKGEVKLGDLADISRTSKAVKLGARFRGQPAVAVMPFKQPGANTLALIDQLKAYIDTRNRVSANTGVQLFLLIDDSDSIRNAISTMEEHAWSGMLLVFAVTWLLLGARLSLLTTLAVPFSLAGVFIALQVTKQSLNLSVLSGRDYCAGHAGRRCGGGDRSGRSTITQRACSLDRHRVCLTRSLAAGDDFVHDHHRHLFTFDADDAVFWAT